ncbi:MAG TPA: YggS family pyridoxal phosphate-dependent enzyme [Flavobacteriaceae bacterium]|nr:YggS family pyridoxal phosphate-dependent enzyme [Flavobacteriaceae bacterium]
MDISENLHSVQKSLPENTTLVAVSKTKPVSDILKAYDAGQRVFGENKIQEMVEKWEQLPKDIKWHMIGHVQRNKVKYMAPFVHLIHAVDSLKLLKEINKEAKKNKRTINCLLQVKIAEEATKFGMEINLVETILSSEEVQKMKHINIIGFMGMATFTENKKQISKEFVFLKKQFDNFSKKYPSLKILSMGMSGDYEIALEHGSNMVRIGSAIFGKR